MIAHGHSGKLIQISCCAAAQKTWWTFCTFSSALHNSPLSLKALQPCGFAASQQHCTVLAAFFYDCKSQVCNFNNVTFIAHRIFWVINTVRTIKSGLQSSCSPVSEPVTPKQELMFERLKWKWKINTPLFAQFSHYLPYVWFDRLCIRRHVLDHVERGYLGIFVAVNLLFSARKCVALRVKSCLWLYTIPVFFTKTKHAWEDRTRNQT